MIDRPAVAHWRVEHPWKTLAQVEQDLLICRCLVEIFRDEFLAEVLHLPLTIAWAHYEIRLAHYINVDSFLPTSAN